MSNKWTTTYATVPTVPDYEPFTKKWLALEALLCTSVSFWYRWYNMYVLLYAVWYNVIYYYILESSASFESNYVVGEGDGHVELTVTLSQEVLINNTSIGLRTVDDTTTSKFL